MARTVISVSPKSILTKEKFYSLDHGKLVEMYFVYRIKVDEKGRTWHIPLSTEDYPECDVKLQRKTGHGIRSLRKAKMIHLLESI